jgi:hypothetical protein
MSLKRIIDDYRFSIYPASVDYSWGFWFDRLKELSPEKAHGLCLNHSHHAALAEWHACCPACGV